MTGLVFSKRRMLERLEKEGRAAELSPEVLAVMDALDGGEAIESCWRRRVYDEAVYYVHFAGEKAPAGQEGKGEYVNEEDCVPPSVWETEREAPYSR